ncbi:hypothetical protein M406DRAFT_329121 [Cryphonectria parasitica EP155]|uniref:SnoaL-like domain-containing protein n=1 Tax=Cryphonectria parasitica (strain ATCC 38755 / EP155) TaxID=660469 RepID=A0A9P5CS92_CRYP1|nr:uncharacterized protein M406DRAFT_329121 [Cryphonectria parasitica EP155]KAF3768081.1 hypothetical protein M406DRAFT_329121 [Cryphonectria parasitica EP155]
MAEDTSPRRKLAIQVIDSYRSWDLDKIMSLRADDCVTVILPKSLGQPEMDNAAYRKFFSFSLPLFQDFNPQIQDIIEDEKGNKVTLWCTSTADTVIGPYANEYMITLHFNEACDKVVRFLEFVDSHVAKTHFEGMRKFVEAKEAEKAKEARLA